MQWTNPVKQKLLAGEPVIAATLSLNGADAAAHLARLGFDFLWTEMEHSPISLESLRNIVLATHGLPCQTFARVPVAETWMAKRVLDAGVSGVIFPFVSTPELAARAVAACRYPPNGVRGSGASLAKLTWPEPDRYTDSADENVVVVLMIEEAAAVQNIEAIAATAGAGALFIGTSDLSFSLGLRGRQNEPLLTEAIARVLAAGKQHGIPVGRPLPDPARAAEFLEQGFRLFQGPTDIGFLQSGARRYQEIRSAQQ